MDPLILAIYLPQYYRTEYNDRWWGEGYTEWTACKKAMPLFEGHVQPRIPYREYDLSQPDSIYNQVSMAKELLRGFDIYIRIEKHCRIGMTKHMRRDIFYHLDSFDIPSVRVLPSGADIKVVFV